MKEQLKTLFKQAKTFLTALWQAEEVVAARHWLWQLLTGPATKTATWPDLYLPALALLILLYAAPLLLLWLPVESGRGLISTTMLLWLLGRTGAGRTLFGLVPPLLQAFTAHLLSTATLPGLSKVETAILRRWMRGATVFYLGLSVLNIVHYRLVPLSLLFAPRPTINLVVAEGKAA